MTPFFQSPGADPSLLAEGTSPQVAPSAAAKVAVAIPFVTPPPLGPPVAVTPLPAPLPVPGRSWVEQRLANLDAAVKAGRLAAADGEAQARQLKRTIGGLSREGVAGAVSDVHAAAQLKGLLPLVVFAVGFAVGKPLLGGLAAAGLWVASEKGGGGGPP